MFFGAPGASAEDADLFRSRLSKPDEVQRTKRGYRFHAATEEDLEVVKTYILTRIGREERR